MKQRIDKIFLRDAILRVRDDWDESKHNRAENGQFTSGGGGSATGGGEDRTAKIAALKEQMTKFPLFGAGSEKRKALREQIKALEAEMTPESKPQSKRPEITPAKVEPKAEKQFPVTEHKNKQFEIIQQTNPMSDDYHVGIRKPSEIRTAEEAFTVGGDDEFVYPDFTRADAERALRSGRITVYSSKPIKNGGFVSPSKMMAGDYSGGGKVYSQVVPLNSVAWINSGEGQFAQVS